MIPPRRMAITQDTDLPGNDLRQIFDTSMDACLRNCMADSACMAVTYNAQSSACFPKSSASLAQPFPGAFSARAIDATAEVQALAQRRVDAAPFLDRGLLQSALSQAQSMSDHMTGGLDGAALSSFAREAVNNGDFAQGQRLLGAAIAVDDRAEDWGGFAELALRLGSDRADRQAAQAAAVNAYLRAQGDATAAEALFLLARVLEDDDRGRDALSALRLANGLDQRQDIALALQDAEEKYGFRITDQVVESDLALPRICALFNEELQESLDYTPYVALPQTGMSVQAETDRVCVAGLDHGARYELTFRQGLPSASGDAMGRDVQMTQYIRDRAPMVRFEGRNYILPRMADAGLPVVTVNTDVLDLRLIRVSDRNLVQTLRDGYMARPLDYWSEQALTDRMGDVVWEGHADVGGDLNAEMTTRLPIQEITGPLGTGIYALQAQVPDTSPNEVAPATQWFVISDLGISALQGSEGMHVILRGLTDTAARSGARVALLSRGNEVLAEAESDDQGVVVFPADVTSGQGNAAPAAITVADGDDMAFLPLTDPEFDLSDRGVEGMPPAPPVDVFLTTDRGAYRAGETVQTTILARSGADQRALSGLPLTAVLTRPDGVELTRQIAPEAGAGGHTADFALPVTAPRGTWRVDVLADPDAPPLASARLLVEDFLPERLDFTVQIPQGPLAMDALPEIALDVRYLFGAPGAGLEVEGETRLSATDSLPDFEGYHFGRYDERFSPRTEYLSPGVTDDQGQLLMTASLPEDAAQAMRPLTADFIVSVREGSGRPVERVESRTVLPDQPVAGIRPLFADGAVAEGVEAGFAVLGIGPDGQQIAGPADWVVNRIETDYQWYSMDGRWDYEMITRRNKVSEGNVDLLADAPAQVSLALDWGRYEIVVTPQGGGAASYDFDSGWYTVAGSLQTPDRMSVAMDQARYSAGDTAVALIDAPEDGVALISVLTNRVVDLKLVPVEAGENRVDLPVTDAWGTGAYVTASAIRAVGADGGHAPVRALGLAHAAIEPGDRALTAAIDAPAEADPRGVLPVTLRVDGAAGQRVHATLAAVDLGILNLTGFDAPDPSAHYFGQRRLGVAIRDIYGRLIDGQAGAQGAIRSGGDAMAQLSTQSPPPTDELLSWFSGPVTLSADGSAQLEIPLPAFNGTVRLMAVMWSDKGVGQASQDVLVRDPVVLTASAPRFLAPGDQARVLLELTHASGPSGQIGLAASGQGLALGDLPATVTLTDQETQRLSLPITAPETVGATQLALSVTTPDGRQLDKTLTIPVIANGATISRESQFRLASGDDLTLPPELLENMQPGTGSATLALGPAARFDAAAMLRGLADYPYGCTEQITSKAMPLLAFSAAAQGMPDADRAAERVDQAIARVLTRQAASGAFGLWSPENGDDWLNAYVTDFLSRARSAGHDVPDQAFRMALDRLRNKVNYAADFDADSNGGGEALAYALMVLAREGAVPVGDLRYYADEKGGDFGTPLAVAQVGAALAMYGDQRRADAMFARVARMLIPQGEEPYVFRADYGTRLRDLAGVLALAAGAGTQAVPLDGLGDSLERALQGQTLSPQEAVWSLMAAGQMVSGDGGGFTLNGQALGGALIRDVTADGGALVHNGSGREELVTLTLTGVPTVPEPAGGKGYTITRDYYDHDGQPVDPASVLQGDRLVAVLTVTPHQSGGGRLIVDDPLPAGFEIENPHLIRQGDNSALDWLDALSDVEASEFRDDRFITAVDWTSDDSFRLAYNVRAITPGSFLHPAASVMDMYRPDWRGWTAAGRVSVTE
ncbi:alpha-2-macroglobulin family protein [Paracoccus tegillarcae]|uniref:alpha-2-macroglobulin family protein n=1 Tax=Paracoccus tegillarcae TaxID=1529068 RepID=UPI0030CD745F